MHQQHTRVEQLLADEEIPAHNRNKPQCPCDDNIADFHPRTACRTKRVETEASCNDEKETHPREHKRIEKELHGRESTWRLKKLYARDEIHTCLAQAIA